MSNEIDWTKPLETNEAEPKPLVVEAPEVDGTRWVFLAGGNPVNDGAWFKENGTTSLSGDEFFPNGIRNRTAKPANAPSPELAARMVACIRAVSQMPGTRQAEKARAILAELEPKPDADEHLAMEVSKPFIGSVAISMTLDDFEQYDVFQSALAAIKRVRSEK